MTLPELTGVILAGGQAKRMGGHDKGLIMLAGKPLYQYILERLQPQVSQVIINANRNLDIYRQSGCRVISDNNAAFLGPLAGMLVGLENSPTDWVLFVPCDTPFMPLNLAEKLWQFKGKSRCAFAFENKRSHPTLALIHTSLKAPLRRYLAAGERKLLLFLEQQQVTEVSFNEQPDAFQNFNTLEECGNWQQRQG